jgi:uncharacterized membrane protein
VNDPTTATQMINHREAVLAGLGRRVLSGRGALTDSDGHLRLAVHTRSWEDYLDLGVSEILQYGRGSPQICRRLRAMFIDLDSTVLSVNRPAVRRQLDILDETVRLTFGEGSEQAFALVQDRQGVGGPSQPPAGIHIPDRT